MLEAIAISATPPIVCNLIPLTGSKAARRYWAQRPADNFDAGYDFGEALIAEGDPDLIMWALSAARLCGRARRFDEGLTAAIALAAVT